MDLVVYFKIVRIVVSLKTRNFIPPLTKARLFSLLPSIGFQIANKKTRRHSKIEWALAGWGAGKIC
jgi:hypothetical protein